MTNPVAAERFPWAPYVVPFAVFMVLLGLEPVLPLPFPVIAGLRFAVVAVAILLLSRRVLRFRPERPLATVGIGIAVFLLWILPDQLLPGYRDGWLLQNALTGSVESSIPVEYRTNAFVLVVRFLRASLLVPIVEELFWRAWLPRWIDHPEDFRTRPLGQMTRFAFWGTAVLFALEHGAFWDVGLVAGVIYNWWMIRTRSLGDLILAHGVTNACLAAWVVGAGQWQYW